MSCTVYTGGTFDLFHAGHVELLRGCRALAGPHGRVVAALNTDEFVEAFKGRRPLMSLGERVTVVHACRYVDDVVVNLHGGDSRPTIETVRPAVIAVGSDWQGRDYYAQMGFDQAWLDERAIAVVFLSRPADGPSTTKLRSLATSGARPAGLR